MAKGTRKTAETVGKVRGVVKGPLRGYVGIFQTLATDHGEVKSLMSKVSRSNDPDIKKEVFAAVRRELLAHAQAEEVEFYGALREHPSTRALAERSVKEHHDFERTIAELHAMDAAHPAWSKRFEALRRAVDDHVDEEEQDLFPLAKEALTPEQVDELDERFQRTKAALTPRA